MKAYISNIICNDCHHTLVLTVGIAGISVQCINGACKNKGKKYKLPIIQLEPSEG